MIKPARLERRPVEEHSRAARDASDRIHGPPHARAQLRLAQLRGEEQRVLLAAVQDGLADVDAEAAVGQAGEERDAGALDLRADAGGLAEMMEVGREAG